MGFLDIFLPMRCCVVRGFFLPLTDYHFSPTTAMGSMSRVSTQRQTRPDEFYYDLEDDNDLARNTVQQQNGSTSSYASRRPSASTPRSRSRRRKQQETLVVSAMQSYIQANDTIIHAMIECTTSLVDALEILEEIENVPNEACVCVRMGVKACLIDVLGLLQFSLSVLC
ncbi:hypothetical protein PHJA_001384800 [Phtheirospermum japonicum]|uniref:Uncharacterized protein n=1 Tax=Phtheirospermum japonicum TaxID=374723 RepID=A0A830BZV9_9LAMI|nr:hypothetical protein PHJA_001384800 [Phtheirospermum japonicum]